MVRLEGPFLLTIPTAESLFQFLIGAIGRSTVSDRCVASSVSIPHWCDWKRHEHQTGTRVAATFQFLIGAIGRSKFTTFRLVVCKFQFLIGAIGRIRYCIACVMTCLFQFLIGAIGRLLIMLSITIMMRFNSSLVRLEVVLQDETPELPQFQFLIGAIGRAGSPQNCMDTNVSIPHWCDWKRFKTVNAGEDKFVSIPHWCDWKSKIGGLCSRPGEFQFLIGAIGSYSPA